MSKKDKVICRVLCGVKYWGVTSGEPPVWVEGYDQDEVWVRDADTGEPLMVAKVIRNDNGLSELVQVGGKQ